MKDTNSISEYRIRLDKTLSSHDLTNVETLGALVKNQIDYAKEDVDNIVEIRTAEVSNILGMLRTSDDGWNLKQDTEEYRVMYREGPVGSPFHSLLVEGYVDAPLDVCLCISWEAQLYPKWWPQTVVPAFKIMSSQCLKKMRAGEQICLIRMKVSWPLSAREALVHYFEFEYFQDDLVVVLFNSISDLGGISKSTHGFTRDGIPDAEDVIRIDLIGGFALQKVSANRSFFRTISNVDIKLDFIPPTFINFISRQLVGAGFKLYKKEVASITKGDDDFGKALTDPLYARVREAKYGDSNTSSTLVKEPYAEENKLEAKHPLLEETISQQEIVNTYSEIEEIKEEDVEKSESLSIVAKVSSSSFNVVRSRKEVVIRPEVKKALRTLEMAITGIRERGVDIKTPFSPVVHVEKGLKESVSLDPINQIGTPSTLLKEDRLLFTSNEARNSSGNISSRRQGSNSYLRDTNHNKIAPVSPNLDGGAGTHHTSQSLASRFSASETDQTVVGNDNRQQIRKRKSRFRFRCLSAFPWSRRRRR